MSGYKKSLNHIKHPWFDNRWESRREYYDIDYFDNDGDGEIELRHTERGLEIPFNRMGYPSERPEVIIRIIPYSTWKR